MHLRIVTSNQLGLHIIMWCTSVSLKQVCRQYCTKCRTVVVYLTATLHSLTRTFSQLALGQASSSASTCAILLYQIYHEQLLSSSQLITPSSTPLFLLQSCHAMIRACAMILATVNEAET